MKESEALNMLCPHMALDDDGCLRNCVGSSCMMWKPREIDPTYSTLGDEPEGDCGLKR